MKRINFPAILVSLYALQDAVVITYAKDSSENSDAEDKDRK